MHAGPDEALDERRQNVALDPPCLVERRDEIREDAVVAGVKHRQASFDRHRLARTPSHQSHDERQDEENDPDENERGDEAVGEEDAIEPSDISIDWRKASSALSPSTIARTSGAIG